MKLTPVSPLKRPRQPGSAKGLITISDDFDEPLKILRNIWNDITAGYTYFYLVCDRQFKA